MKVIRMVELVGCGGTGDYYAISNTILNSVFLLRGLFWSFCGDNHIHNDDHSFIAQSYLVLVQLIATDLSFFLEKKKGLTLHDLFYLVRRFRPHFLPMYGESH